MVALNSHNPNLTVKELRLAVGLSGAEFARLVGIHTHYIYRFDKKNIAELRVSQLQKISRAIRGRFEAKFELASGHFISLGEVDPSFEPYDTGVNTNGESKNCKTNLCL
jgi:transcriptional regulator with XRE-family HTH domain